jgi:hypothetical protein
MPRPSEIQAIIEKAVAEVLEAALPGLQQEIVARANAALVALVPAPGSSPTELLSAAATAIQGAASQADILRQLLEGGAGFAGRVALFVVKSGAVTGWEATGFENNNGIKNISLNGVSGAIAEAIQGRAPVFASTADLDESFVSSVNAPGDGKCLLLPLVVKEKVAALIYADAGVEPSTTFDASALSVLTRFAALWLETSTVRKTGTATPAEEPAQAANASAGAPTTVAASSAAAAAPASEEADLHKKARRFAKLLVEEIMLYNQAKVTQGKKTRDLYDRLREDIEKSRATYDKRYGESPVASANYFNQELVRILADNDVSLMGAAFPH